MGAGRKITAVMAVMLAAALWSAVPGASRRGDGIRVEGFRAERTGGELVVEMELDLSGLDIGSSRAVLLVPRLENGNTSLSLSPVAVYGRRRYYYYRRNGGGRMLSGGPEVTVRAKDRREGVNYRESVPYAEWQEGATLRLYRLDYGCCDRFAEGPSVEVGRYEAKSIPEPSDAGQKEEMPRGRRTVEGRANIDYPPEGTEVLEAYRDNVLELSRIDALLRPVMRRGTRVDTVWLKGYASPESAYDHNRELAQRRTESLRAYLAGRYGLEGATFVTECGAEDWEGLRAAVAKSDLPHREEILELIDTEMDPDVKEWKIKSTYAEDYRRMVDEIYPSLRRTEWRVTYTLTGE